MIKKFPLYLDSHYDLTYGKVRHFVFKLQNESKLQFIAGQFISLHLEHEGVEKKRNYSIANAPGGNTVELACSYIPGGISSEKLFNLRPGDEILASGAYGRFILNDENHSRYILIATGTGVTPYRAMLQLLCEKIEKNNVDVVILFGCRTREDLLYSKEFVELSRKYKNFTFVACYSREQSAILEDYERSGYVQSNITELSLHPEQDIIYLCGNPKMVDETNKIILDLGFDQHKIRREKYIASK